MWGQSAHVEQLRPGAPDPAPAAASFHSTAESVAPAGTVAPQPPETRLRRTATVTPITTRTANRSRPTYVNLALFVCPLISGLFFGGVATLLLLADGNVGHAFEVGALAGTVIFAANALALCIVISTRSDDMPLPRPQSQSRGRDATGARTS